ncbi:S-adenosylmethionine mitochondrial carrier protein isoform X1 [Fundulus heteroclitus]|uniref:S-adenosylmethionine mitochondrial carrier protein isoform X1 n=1 Tax=Fundulus heteroclitus TaxID=8078 RepID=UPI00165AFDE2|nr:S-adenosylmethionine mitochondrial carrier protein isoform X1 [Fundulus heteroclitus]
MERREFVASLVAGGCAGMSVDLTLFPLDTIKTRLQSQQGFHKAGGFRGIYAGVPSAAVGSFPNAAAFFVTYECAKSLLGASAAFAAPHAAPVSHMLAASLGEIVACLIRVPTEVVKQRTQASPSSSSYNMLRATLTEEGFRGLYRGYSSTVLREIPFSLVQFPLWEYLKTLWSQRQGHTLHSWQSAVCGAFAGRLGRSERQHPDGALRRVEEQRPSRAVCRQRPKDGIHQRGRLHLPGSIREDPPHVAMSRASWQTDLARRGRENLCGGIILSPLASARAAGARGAPRARFPEFRLTTLPRVLHSYLSAHGELHCKRLQPYL